MLPSAPPTAPEELQGVLARLPGLVEAASSSDKHAIPTIVREDVYCSKVGRKQATHQSRFTWLPTYRRIMAHAHPDCVGPDEKGRWPRPESSPLPCFQCHQYFTGPPCFLPIVVLNGDRTEWGNFCDPSCANTYLHYNMNTTNLADRHSNLHEYCRDVHGFTGDSIGFAPHFTELECYGGSLTLEQFRLVATTPGFRTFQRQEPFIPTPVVIEWQSEVVPGFLNAAHAMAAPPPPPATSTKPTTTSSKYAPPPPSPPVPSSFGLGKFLVTCNPTLGTEAAAAAAAAAAATAAVAPPPETEPAETEGTPADPVLGARPEPSQHHQWEVQHLRLPSQQDLEARLRQVQSQHPPQVTGLYHLYYEKKQAAATAAAAAATAATPAAKRPAEEPAAGGPEKRRAAAAVKKKAP